MWFTHIYIRVAYIVAYIYLGNKFLIWLLTRVKFLDESCLTAFKNTVKRFSIWTLTLILTDQSLWTKVIGYISQFIHWNGCYSNIIRLNYWLISALIVTLTIPLTQCMNKAKWLDTKKTLTSNAVEIRTRATCWFVRLHWSGVRRFKKIITPAPTETAHCALFSHELANKAATLIVRGRRQSLSNTVPENLAKGNFVQGEEEKGRHSILPMATKNNSTVERKRDFLC